MATPLTVDWDGIQERNIDYKTPVDSDNHNKLVKIVGGSKAYIKGLDLTFELDEDNHRMQAILSPGIFVLNYMVIEFKQAAVIELFSCPITERDVLVVIEYNYRKILPRAYAVIKTILPPEYNPQIHMRLYGFHIPNYNTCPTVEQWTEYYTTHPGYVDYRYADENIPAWAYNLFVLKSGDTMHGPLMSIRDPEEDLEFATKHYIDGKIASHDMEHADTYLQLVGGTLTGPLYLHADPVDDMEAVTKEYVDNGDALLSSTFDDYYTKTQSDDRFVHKNGDAMTGYLTLVGDPTEPNHAATKSYVDTFVHKSGDVMTGYLTLAGDPTNDNHAANKHYVDLVSADLHGNYYDRATSDDRFVLVVKDDGADTTITNTSSNMVFNVPATNSIMFKVGAIVSGSVTSHGFIGATYNADIAEAIVVDTNKKPEHGQCLVYRDGKIILSDSIGDPGVIGIVSYTAGHLLSMSDNYDYEFENNKKVPIALAGQLDNVIVYADYEMDTPLVVSGHDGYLYAIDRPMARNYIGCIVGKVIGRVKQGKNVVKVIIWRS